MPLFLFAVADRISEYSITYGRAFRKPDFYSLRRADHFIFRHRKQKKPRRGAAGGYRKANGGDQSLDSFSSTSAQTVRIMMTIRINSVTE